MRKNKKDQYQNKNIRLGYYFIIVVIFIIVISFSVKVFDSIKNSKFERGNHFTFAIINNKSTEIVSLSPKEGTIKKLTIKGIKNESSLINIGIPYDSIAISNIEINQDPRDYFTKVIFRSDGLKSDLTLYDLINLIISSKTIGRGNITEEVIDFDDEAMESIISNWFVDPAIESENLKIEVTNATEVSGLGGSYASLISKTGGNVVLVNSSQDEINESKIYYIDDSYTLKKLSKLLDIPIEKKEMNTVTDITIQIGKDKVSDL